MNFEFIATYVELQDIPSYSTNITVEGQLLKLSFLWNERIGKRVLSIKNTSDVVYLQNTILHHNEPLELNSNAVLDDLPYSVTLVKTGDISKVGNIFNWSKDFILCFSRTVDLDVKKLNVVYGVTTPSTPILPPPTPAFGDWILNQGFTILGDDVRYTGYKTNGGDTYDSFALISLQGSLVKSLLDPNLQQRQAVKDAIGQLTGASSWTFANANKVVRYDVTNPDINAVASTLTQRHSKSPSNFVGKDVFTALIEGIGWMIDEGGSVTKPTSNNDSYASSADIPSYSEYYYSISTHRPPYYINPSFWGVSAFTCSGNICSGYDSHNSLVFFTQYLNSNYKPSSQPPSSEVTDSDIQIALQQALLSNNAALAAAITAAYTYDVVGFNELYDSLSITYQQVADKIIANSNAEDQGVSLLAQEYIQEVLLKFADVDSIKSQLEANKVLR